MKFGQFRYFFIEIGVLGNDWWEISIGLIDDLASNKRRAII